MEKITVSNGTISENKNHIFFIVPPGIAFEDLQNPDPNKIFGDIVSSTPMGVLSLAGYAKKHTNSKISILDMNVHVRDEMKSGMDWNLFLEKCMKEKIGMEKVDIVGISAIFNVNAGYIASICDTAKKIWPDTIVIAGGGLPSNLSEEVFTMAPSIDGISYGEGEKPLVKLIQAKNKLSHLEEAKGWITKEGLKEKKSKKFLDPLFMVAIFRK